MDEANSQENQPELPQAELPPSQTPPSTSPRKRQADHDSSNDEPRLKRVRLTRKNLATFDKMGKKKTSDPTDGSSTTTKTTSTTTSGFAVKSRNNGILDRGASKPPTNLDDLRKRHAKSRETASPPESAYEDYIERVQEAGNEATVVVETSQLLKKYPKGYKRAFNRAFSNFPKNVGFNNGLSAPQPDFIEGVEAEEYRPFLVGNHIPGATIFDDDPRSLTLPHIAGEWKGPSGSMNEARLQSAYDGAALVHSRNQALAYMGKSDPPGHAEIVTFTTDGTDLNLYAHYATPSAEGKDTPDYHQYRISTSNMTDTYQGHKDGRKVLRNAQDYAKQQSYAMRDELKEHWEQRLNKLPPVAEGVHPPDVEPPPHATDGYEDASPHVLQEAGAEDEDDYEIVQPTTPRESSHHSKSSHRHHSSSQHSSKSHHHSSHHHSSHHHSSHHSSPHHSSKSSHHSSSHSSSQKRKAPSSQTSSHGASAHASKHGSYWKKNSEGHYYHKHSDGTVTWYDDVKDHHRH